MRLFIKFFLLFNWFGFVVLSCCSVSFVFGDVLLFWIIIYCIFGVIGVVLLKIFVFVYGGFIDDIGLFLKGIFEYGIFLVIFLKYSFSFFWKIFFGVFVFDGLLMCFWK